MAKRADRKNREMAAAIDDERRHAEQYKEQVWSWLVSTTSVAKTWRPLGRGQDTESKFSKSVFIQQPLRIFLKDSAHCLYPFRIDSWDTPRYVCSQYEEICIVMSQGMMIRTLFRVWRGKNAEMT